MGIYQQCVILVIVIVSCMYFTSVSNVFKHEELDLGPQHYAEILRIPTTEVMPLNTLVNIGYIIVGLYWCGITKASRTQGILKAQDSYFFYFFNNLACMYGTVSLIRMITQRAVWAVIDRWSTFLFFALVPLWSSHITAGCKLWLFVCVMSASFLGYPLIVMSPLRYEVGVGLHIVFAVYSGLMAYRKYHSKDSLYYLLCALVSCFIFASCNLLDHTLPSISSVFNYISGHFISRVFDASQIYFVNSFFFDLTLEKAASMSLEDKQKWIREDEELRKKKGYDIPYENPMKIKGI